MTKYIVTAHGKPEGDIADWVVVDTIEEAKHKAERFIRDGFKYVHYRECGPTLTD